MPDAVEPMWASLPIYVFFFVTIAFTVLFPDIVLWLPKVVAGIGRLLQEPERCRLHLPAVTWQMVKAGGCHGSH
jgi:hypothetical protein